MLYIVLIPGWIWCALLTSTWSALAFLGAGHLKIRRGIMLGLLAVMALQLLAASSTAIVTSFDPLNDYACRMGYFGMWVAGLTSLIEVFFVALLFSVWPGAEEGRRRLFKTWGSLWFVFNLLALLAHMRSTALCSV